MCINAWISDASVKHVWAPPSAEAKRYSASDCDVLEIHNGIIFDSIRDYHIYKHMHVAHGQLVMYVTTHKSKCFMPYLQAKRIVNQNINLMYPTHYTQQCKKTNIIHSVYKYVLCIILCMDCYLGHCTFFQYGELHFLAATAGTVCSVYGDSTRRQYSLPKIILLYTVLSFYNPIGRLLWNKSQYSTLELDFYKQYFTVKHDFYNSSWHQLQKLC